MNGSRIEQNNIEYSNYGQRTAAVDEMIKADAYLRSSAGMYCAECSKAGKKIYSSVATGRGSKMKALCKTCYKRQELKRRLKNG